MHGLRSGVRRFVALTLAALLLLAAPASAARTDTNARRKAVREKRAAAAAKVNALRATDAQVSKALDALDANVKKQVASVANARADQIKAEATLSVAAARQATTEAQLGTLREEIKRVAVRAYVRGPGSGMGSILDTPSLVEATRRRAYFDFAVGHRTDALDELHAAREDLGARRAAAENARKRAADRRGKVEQQLANLKLAESDQQRVADAVEQRLDSALSEAASLEGLDAQLSAELSRRQDQLVRRLQNGPDRPGVGRTVQVGSITVANVGGIVVAASIAPQVAALLTAAAADGIILSGGGYRDPQQQIALRRAHCGSSQAAIYSTPPSRCRPPTARPGSSMHERGLAIDFTSGRSVIRSRGSPAWKWLNAHAARYGLHNLRSEPWHWSTNGN